MYSIRKWIFKPKRTDSSQLAQFFYADEELNLVAAELDSFDGRKDPERCTALVNQLRLCQDKVLNIIEQIMQVIIPTQRANRDFRVKFPDDVLQDSLAGQLWFGAECLAAGSSIMSREVESASMRPLAKALTRHLDYLRSSLRDQCLRNLNIFNDKIREALMVFDRLFAEFELSYVSAMVPVKTMKEYDVMQEVIVLFCETTQRALRLNLLTQDMLDDYDPAIMFTIPRLAIVCGLLVYPEGPLNPDMDPMNMSEMFRPFQTLLYKIRELLWTLSKDELWMLEKSLCSAEEPGVYRELEPNEYHDEYDAEQFSTFPTRGLRRGVPHITQSESGNHLSVEHLEYNCGSMSQSPSAVTIVANPNYCTVEEIPEETEKQYLAVNSNHSNVPGNRSNMTHQDSNDSGMLSSENGSLSESLQPGASVLYGQSSSLRTLRHSLSWPEPTHRMQRCNRHSESLEDECPETDPSNCTRHSGSHEFSLHLPMNTETDRSSPQPKTIPVISVEGNTPPDSEQGLNSRRIYFSNDSLGESLDEGQQIAYVTDTLNEVFVTDSILPDSSHASSVESVASAEAEETVVTQCNEQPVTSSAENSPSKHKLSDSSPCGSTQGSPVKQKQTSADTRELEMEVNHFNEKGNMEQSEKDLILKPPNSKTKLSCTTCSSCDSLSKSGEGQKGEELNGTDCVEVPCIQRLKYTESMSSSCASCRSRCRSPSVASVDCDWDRESYASSETSSYNSECHDDEEIALAIQAAELAARREARSRFKSSGDLIHRLFVCISGVADQLQTNYASDLRHILKAVFECNASEPFVAMDAVEDRILQNLGPDVVDNGSDNDDISQSEDNCTLNGNNAEEPPAWVPDDQSPHCTSCKVPFTFVRRRHHCRNCGKIFCGRCSSNSVPLPHYGHQKPVRVCNHCFMFQVTPFTVSE